MRWEGNERGVRGGLIGGESSVSLSLNRRNSSPACVTPWRRDLRPDVEDDPVIGDVTTRDLPVSERGKKKKKIKAGWVAGLSAFCVLRGGGDGLAQLGWSGSGFFLFFSDKAFLLFQNSKHIPVLK